MALTLGLLPPTKCISPPPAPAASLRLHQLKGSFINPSPCPKSHLRLQLLSFRTLSLHARAEVSEPVLTEPEIMPDLNNTTTADSYAEQGEVTEAEFSELAMEGDYHEDGQHDAQYDGQYDAQYGGQYEGQYGEGYYDQQQQFHGYDGQYDQSQYPTPPPQEEAPAEPPPYYDNLGKTMKFIAVGRAMQLKLDTQKDFERFLDHCNAYGVMVPEKPGDIKRNLCELDPKETWIVVDSRAVLKFAKKLALEEAEKNKDYPPGFVENMLNRDKYGRYKSDDD